MLTSSFFFCFVYIYGIYFFDGIFMKFSFFDGIFVEFLTRLKLENYFLAFFFLGRLKFYFRNYLLNYHTYACYWCILSLDVALSYESL